MRAPGRLDPLPKPLPLTPAGRISPFRPVHAHLVSALLYLPVTVDDQTVLPNTQLTPKQVECLLDTLCGRLGFCLPPLDIGRLASDPPTEVLEFVNAVFRAEGMDPRTSDRALYRQVKALVAKAFERVASSSGEAKC